MLPWSSISQFKQNMNIYKSSSDELLLEVRKNWEAISQNKSAPDKDLELRVYKKMLEILQVGPSYFFIFNPPLGDIEYCSEHIADVLGYQPEELTIDFMMQCIHPDDFRFFCEFEDEVVNFKMNLPPEKIMKYKSRYNYRIRKKNGKFVKILQQSVSILCDDDGAVLRNFCVHTDISHLKDNNIMDLSFIGLSGEPSFYNYKSNRDFLLQNVTLTKRELEIVFLVIENMDSYQIADKLSISVETVKTHRKNINSKTNTHSAFELYKFAEEKGWI